MISVYRFIKGLYTVKLSGERSQRVLNRALKKKLYITDLKKTGEYEYELFLSPKGLEILKKISEEAGVTFEVLEFRGLKKILSGIKKRKMFFYAAVTSAVCVLFSASFIWKIEIPEADYITKEEIMSVLKKYGIEEGKIRKSYDFKKISNELVTKYENLIWANVELSGTKINVTVVPRTHAPKIVSADVPADIIALKDGVITEITAENGEKRVKVGDTVIKGQVLISGLIPSERVGTRYVHSEGSVKAKTWVEKEKKQKLFTYEKNFTGRAVKKAEFEIPFVKIPLNFKKNIDFYNYECIIEERDVLFLTFRNYIYSEYNLKKTPISEAEAVKKAENELQLEITEEASGIKNMKTTFKSIDEDTVSVRVLAECEEEIGGEREIKKADKTIKE